MSARRIGVLVLLLLILTWAAARQGPAARSTASSSQMGLWEGPYPFPLVAVHLTVLPNGKAIFWEGGDDDPGEDSSEVHLWDPTAPDPGAPTAFERIDNPNSDLFCAGHALLPDGTLLVAGGHIANNVGLSDVNFFDFATNSWLPQGPDMNAGRWYPTATTLPNGDTLVLSGEIDTVVGTNPLPQVWQRATGTWRGLTSAQRDLPYYPWMYVAPNGQVFQAGWNSVTRYLNTSGTGSWKKVATNNSGLRNYGSSVMYDTGKVLIVGGHYNPTATAEVINLNASSPTWQYTNPMAKARRHLSSTLLPDGKVLVTGGSSGPGNNLPGAVRAAEMWDPQTEQWTTLASMQEPRVYHSTAVLLPDGRVVAAGGGRPAPAGDVDHKDAEIFSPPYLFSQDGSPAARPTITSAPSSVTWGQSFPVTAPDAASIAKVTWIRLSSMTHAFNMGQRINFLTFSKTGTDSLSITAPANRNLAPPGHYMLFILNSSGVPSVAKIIKLQ